MSQRPFIVLLLLTLLVSLAGLTLSAALEDKWHSALSAGIYAISAIATGARINLPCWFRSEAGPDQDLTRAAKAFRRTTRVTAITYAWGAIAMFLMYGWAGLSWRHGWQYGAAMALIAAGLASYARLMRPAGNPLESPRALGVSARLAALHGIVASTAIVWLVASGKLATQKADWAANNIFLAGGLAIVVLSAFAVRTHRKLVHPDD